MQHVSKDTVREKTTKSERFTKGGPSCAAGASGRSGGRNRWPGSPASSRSAGSAPPANTISMCMHGAVMGIRNTRGHLLASTEMRTNLLWTQASVKLGAGDIKHGQGE